MTLAARRELLVLVLDALIPASGGFPGAGAVALDHVLAASAASAELASLLFHGLDVLEDTARADGDAGLGALNPDERENVLRRVEASQAEFFEALLRHTYDGYYGHSTVIARLGLDPRPVHPRGHQVESVDMPDLARVAARGPIYRPA